MERLTAERDFYFRCLDEKTEEVSLLKAEKQRLVVQVTRRLLKDQLNFLHLCLTALISGQRLKVGE